MKFLHLADLHIGKVLNHFSLLEDQKYILNEIVRQATVHQPDAVLIAGDLYDSSTPGTEAVRLCDEFLTSLVNIPCKVLLISGNHDSAERLSFLSRLVQEHGLYISHGDLTQLDQVSFSDDYGTVNVYLLPFVRPSQVRQFFPQAQLESYTDALRVVLEQLQPAEGSRNVLMTHQFVTGAERSDSELNVGGTDNVDASVFEGFDYVALGHLHRPQQVGSERIRYCGSPLKYSFSEVNQPKTLSLITLWEKGRLSCEELPLKPLRDLLDLSASFDELVSLAQEHKVDPEAYYRFRLTDPYEVPEALSKLRQVYPHLMQLSYPKVESSLTDFSGAEESLDDKTPYEQLQDFFRLQQHKELSQAQQQFCEQLMHTLWEES
ncbi:MAG: exonuclease SbcCD subunit D [Succinivibrio sp.]|nr:exonuclease SbcCD subunit D [Succinivibrio sp.]